MGENKLKISNFNTHVYTLMHTCITHREKRIFILYYKDIFS